MESGRSLYESLNSAIRFSGKVYSSAVKDSEFTMNVASDIIFAPEGEMNFSFDYYHEGTPVAVNVKVGDEDMLHGAEVKVINGKIVKFRMLIREYRETTDKREIMNIYGAIDKVAGAYSDALSPVRINDVFLAYKEDGNSENLIPCWVSYAEGSRIVLD